MDLSRLDTGLPEPLVCLPGTWAITKENPVVKPIELGDEEITMEELLNMTVPGEKKKISPNALFEIPKVDHITPEMKLELAAIRLRRYAYKDKFMKSSDSKDIPSRFHLGTMIGGGMQAVGGGKESQAAGTANRKKKKGKSHLTNLLHDDTVKDWLHRNIQKRTRVARPKSKHPKIKPLRH
jgi:hypothetical protein